MAYYLAFAGGGGQSGQYVALSSRIDIQSGDDFSIFIDCRISANANFYRPLGGDNVQDTSPRVLILNGGTFRLYNTSGTIRSWSTGLNLTTVETIEFRRVSGTLDLLINGAVQSGSIASNTDTFLGFQTINGNSSNASEVSNDLYRLKITVNNVLIHDYNPSSSNGTGDILIDDVSGNNGTLTNFPTDDSQWVFYGEAAANQSTISYDIGAISYSAALDRTSPANSASASYDIGQVDYSVSVSRSAPNRQSVAAYDIGAIAYNSELNNGAPVRSANAAYDIGPVVASAVIVADNPVRTAAAAYDIGGVSISTIINTGAPIRVANAVYDIGAVVYTASIDAQAPVPSDIDAIIGYDIGGIVFGAQIINGQVSLVSAPNSGVSFVELPRGVSFKEPLRGARV